MVMGLHAYENHEEKDAYNYHHSPRERSHANQHDHHLCRFFQIDLLVSVQIIVDNNLYHKPQAGLESFPPKEAKS